MPPSYQKPTAHPHNARAVLIGESNPYSRNPDDALLPWPAGCAGHRLFVLLGWTEDEYLRSFYRLNLVVGERWNLERARCVADEVRTRDFFQDLDVVLLGARVAHAFGWTKPTWEMIYTRGGGMVRIPHPSGLCREWNKPGAREFLRTLMEPYRVADLARWTNPDLGART